MYNGNHRIQTLHSLFKPISYNIPDEAERIHGISTEYAMKNGIHFAEYVDSLRFMIFDADVVVARNIELDVLTVFSNDIIEARYNFSLWEMRIFKTMLSRISVSDDTFNEERLIVKDLLLKYGKLGGGSLYEVVKEAATSVKNRFVHLP
jgi:hypothetical protein